MISLFEPYLNDPKLKKYFNQCIKSTYVATAGKFIELFEKKLKKFIGAKCFVNLTNSGSSALHAAFLANGLDRQDTVIIPSYNFIASSNAAILCGANIWYVDINETNLTIDLKKLELELKKHTYKDNRGNLRLKKNSSKIKIICPTSTYGNFPDLEKLKEIKKKYGLKVILDTAGSLGCEYNFKKLGQLEYDAAILSFNANKLITTSAGGAVISKKKNIYKKIKLLISNGRKNKLYKIFSKGFNYRMTNVQAAIGYSQLNNINKIILKKKKNYNQYKAKIKNPDFKLVCNSNCTKKNYWSPFLIAKNSKKSFSLIKKLNKNKIDTFIPWTFLHKFKYYPSFVTSISTDENFFKRIVPLPNSFSLKNNEIKKIVNIINSKL